MQPQAVLKTGHQFGMPHAAHHLSNNSVAWLLAAGAEFHVFGDQAELGWLHQTQLLSLELHKYLGNVTQVSETLTVRGFKNSTHSEYDVFARDALHRHIGSD